jgi:hypothetical protein
MCVGVFAFNHPGYALSDSYRNRYPMRLLTETAEFLPLIEMNTWIGQLLQLRFIPSISMG